MNAGATVDGGSTGVLLNTALRALDHRLEERLVDLEKEVARRLSQ
jgi:hypothetical protein